MGPGYRPHVLQLDLRKCPSWQCDDGVLSCAVLYRDAADVLCNEAAKTLTQQQWQADAELRSRHERYWGRAYTGTQCMRYYANIDQYGPLLAYTHTLLC